MLASATLRSILFSTHVRLNSSPSANPQALPPGIRRPEPNSPSAANGVNSAGAIPDLESISRSSDLGSFDLDLSFSFRFSSSDARL